MPDKPLRPAKKSTRHQIMALVERLPEDMQLKLLRYLETKLPRHIKGELITEKRTESRRHCLMNVDYEIDGTPHSGYILDISAFGVFIESDVPFEIGGEVRLHFTLPGRKRPYRPEATIVWSGTQGFGARFNALSRHQREEIKTFSEEKSRIYTIIS